MQQQEREARRALHLSVTFWRPGQKDKNVVGYTLNVSGRGMFVATRRPLPPNAAVELNIGHPEGTVRAFARVKHAARYPGHYQALFKSGMGLEFARPEEPTLASLMRMGPLLAVRGRRRAFNQ